MSMPDFWDALQLCRIDEPEIIRTMGHQILYISLNFIVRNLFIRPQEIVFYPIFPVVREVIAPQNDLPATEMAGFYMIKFAIYIA
jgi:hypothetical protein